jgi:transglutaminase-like putative cysteine protease
VTAQSTTARTLGGRTLGELITSIPFRPAEGWLTIIASAAMVAIVATALLDAGWTGNAGDPRFLPWVGMIGLAFGFAGAKLGWGRWRTHLVGALFGGIVVPLIIGGVVLAESGVNAGWDPASLGLRFLATFDVVRNVWMDLVVFGRPVTTEINHYHLVFGVLIWAAGMLTGFTVFGHRRPLDAVVVLGLVLLANLAITSRFQLPHLVAFSAASLLLLMRTHVFEEEVTWSRRKIGDPAAVSQLYLGGGVTFVTAAILGAVLLTFAASSAPLQGLWQDLPRQLQSLTQWLQRFAPPGGDYRGLGLVTFGDNAVTTGQWEPSNKIAFRAQFPRGEKEQFKWRAGTFSEYTGFGWNWGDTRSEPTTPGATILGFDPNGDMPVATDRRTLTIQVRPDAFVGNTVLAPNTIVSVDRTTNALALGVDGWFTTVESSDSLSTYNVTALVPVFKDQAGGVTEPELRAAGTDYPPELKQIYLQYPPDAIGPDAAALLRAVQAAVVVPSYADPTNPYDLARTMEGYFRDSAHFNYQADIRDQRNARCKDASTVECFARIRVGYCDPYASTMTILLRAAGVPARVAYGFLPGDRGADGLETVGAWAAHYWVEVYFPGIGWIEFDPTGGGHGGAVLAIPSGSPLPSTPKPSGPASTFSPRTFTPPSAGPGAPGGPTSGTNVGPFIAIAFILLIGLGALALAAMRRTPSKPMHPDQAWGSIARLASRLGLGPRPSQTVYEYAGALGDAVPAARVELTTIARAKVEVAYGKRDLGSDRMKNIAIAYQRLRFALLGVLMRRGLRRGPRTPKRH